uniref:hypothetical protein n=1 Tax=uncultured Erythrobacter sp. TaxID=263913 RepID=UPI00261C741E|nr:hypothetical protein [uncultured Erythrobacter sp.]
MSRFVVAATVGVVCAVATPASAREVDRQEVAERFAEDVQQEQRLYCRDTQMFTLSDGTRHRACVDWRAQNRTRVIRSYAALNGPEVDADANLDAARECFDLAVASMNDPYRQAFDQDAFLAGARAQFGACAVARNLQRTSEYTLRVYETGVWLGGR